jgi:hypothetical protein
MNGRPRGRPKVSTKEPTMGVFSWFRERGSSGGPSLFQRLVMPRGHPPSPKLEEIQRAAAEDVAAMEAEDLKYFRQDSPGNIEDDL